MLSAQVIVRRMDANGQAYGPLKIYCKGADSFVKPLLDRDDDPAEEKVR